MCKMLCLYVFVGECGILGDREFRKVFTKKSNKQFHYESGRLFSDNYRQCMHGYSKELTMRESFRIPKADMYYRTKMEDALIYRCYHDNFHIYDHRASLFTLRSRDMGESVVQFDLDTGQLVREIFLSHVVKFKYMSWAETNEMFFVKSIQSAERSRFHMVTGISMNISIVLAAFSAFPLKFEGMLEIDRRIFGAGITNAILSHGMLIIMFITGHVKFYSFQYILDHYRKFEHDIYNSPSVASSSYRADGNIPEGLPINIKVTDCPPVLFEVQCADHDVKIGGFPWHYIYTPKGTLGMFFVVVSLNDNTEAVNGTLSTSDGNIEKDTCMFHDDNSGRILHVSGSSVRVLQMKSMKGSDTVELNFLADINAKHTAADNQEPLPQYTSSGRCVRKRQSVDEVTCDNETTLHQVDYEDDLDLTWISLTNHNPDMRYRVCFYDNQSFQLLREVQLDTAENYEECYEYSLYVDLDTIVQLLKPRLGQFVCNVYRLSGDLNSENQSTFTDRGTSNRSKQQAETKSGTRRGLRPRTR